MPSSTAASNWPDAWAERPMDEESAPVQALARLWQAFMAARMVLATVLVGLQLALLGTGTSFSRPLMGVCIAYLLLTLLSRALIQPRPLGQSFNHAWGALAGLDILTFTALQIVQGSIGHAAVNYTPLYALPVLLASVLGSLRLALGTAAGITVLMLGGAVLSGWNEASFAATNLVQPALSGAGFFAVAWLANQLATRLADEGARARQSQLAASMQQQVNELVIESLTDGVLVVDEYGRIRAANPAARSALQLSASSHAAALSLQDSAALRPLLDMARRSIAGASELSDVVSLNQDHLGVRRLHVRTRLAVGWGTSLCVLFLQDQREMEARLRTEKLASMGRLSTAVAHEIRNPLSAIAQANALLDEDLQDPRLKRLTHMVDQNAKRLEKIVNDILNVARVRPAHTDALVPALPLALTVHRVCTEWIQQNAAQRRVLLELPVDGTQVRFDPEHLRRVLVNLLDNALRYTQDEPQTVQIYLDQTRDGLAQAVVWSWAAPVEPSVQEHLFEPFFSSDSRSSGLGLYLCREMCERNRALLQYERRERTVVHERVDGNAFVVTFAAPLLNDPLVEETATPWQPKLY